MEPHYIIKPGEKARIYISKDHYFELKHDGWNVNVSSNMAEIAPRYNKDGSIQIVATSDEIVTDLLGPSDA